MLARIQPWTQNKRHRCPIRGNSRHLRPPSRQLKVSRLEIKEQRDFEALTNVWERWNQDTREVQYVKFKLRSWQDAQVISNHVML